MHGKNLVIIDINDPKLLKKIGQCVVKGKCLLVQDVMEKLDPSLDNLLNKSLTKSGPKSFVVKIGEDELDYNPKF